MKQSHELFPNKDFISSVVHELKNPLNAITGFADILRSEMNNVKKSETFGQKLNGTQNSFSECMDYISEIDQAACEMNELIHDLLDVGSGSSGNFSVDLGKEINVRDVIKRSIRMNYSYSLRRGVVIATEISDDIKPIKLDTRRMKQIVTNLISNAIKYSSENTEIKISARCAEVALGDLYGAQNKFLEISITDHGFGMTPDQIQTAFQKYQTIQNSNSGIVDSFGLGLPITKQLVELQSGTIDMTSEVGKGTEVKLKFPYPM